MNINDYSKLFLVNKPIRWTSFDIVKKIRSSIKKKYNLKKLKVGHAGTLDPLATGLMIICTGKKTKIIEEFLNLNKKYSATVKLGAITDSYDRETIERDKKSLTDLELKKIRKIVLGFVGEYEQSPPIFSAIKLDGEPLYKKARRGERICGVKKRKVVVKDIEIKEINLPFISLNVHCSKGTYIRSLANDMGQKMGCGGYLYSLIRTEIGDFNLNDAIEISQIEHFI
tara:strand:- start:3643 stop:4323 length:681 start_codon:yes stop_codon:yes gene_type:complete